VAESGPKANRVKRLAIMDQDGANVQYITSGKTLALTPRFSPTQQMLTYLNFEDGNPQVYLLDLNTGKQQRLGSFGQMTFSPRFSPDGGTVAFSVEQSGTTNIYALRVGDSRPVQLTSGAAIDTGPCYSPDGQRIVFESDRGGTPQLYVMGAGGGGAQRISYGEGYLFDAGLVAEGRSHRLHAPVGRAVPYRHHEPRWLGRAPAGFELPCRGADLLPQRAGHHVLLRSGRGCRSEPPVGRYLGPQPAEDPDRKLCVRSGLVADTHLGVAIRQRLGNARFPATFRPCSGRINQSRTPRLKITRGKNRHSILSFRRHPGCVRIRPSWDF
jgi:hypothetical protein